MIVCFQESNNFGPWRLFTFWRKKFGHCYIVDYDPQANVWIKAECASERMNFQVFSGEEVTDLVGYLSEYATCIDARGKKQAIYFPRWLYCVSFVKHFLGIKKWWIVTPYQLYCELRKEGCEFIFTETEEIPNG